MASAAAIAAPFSAHAAEESHNSFVGIFVLLLPDSWRNALYSAENWGQLDVIPNTIFIGVVTLVILGLMARRLMPTPESRSQTALEWMVEGLNNQFGPILGEHGRKYLPFINAYFVFILMWNLWGLVPGFQAPTAELNTTVGLAIVSLTTVQIIAIREIGIAAYLKHLWGQPWWLGPLMFPIEVITQVSRVMSLSLRLFANIYAKEVVLFVLYGLAVKVFYIPIQLPVLFIGVLASLIQAFIFAVLTSVYIALFVEHGDHGAEGHTEAQAAHGGA